MACVIAIGLTLGSGSDACSFDEQTTRQEIQTYSTISRVFFISFIGVKIWEIVSVWNLDEQKHTIAKTKRPFLIAPIVYKDGGGLAMLMSF